MVSHGREAAAPPSDNGRAAAQSPRLSLTLNLTPLNDFSYQAKINSSCPYRTAPTSTLAGVGREKGKRREAWRTHPSKGSEGYHSHSVVLSRTALCTRSIRSIAPKARLSPANRTACRAREGIPVPKDKGREAPCSREARCSRTRASRCSRLRSRLTSGAGHLEGLRAEHLGSSTRDALCTCAFGFAWDVFRRRLACARQ